MTFSATLTTRGRLFTHGAFSSVRNAEESVVASATEEGAERVRRRLRVVLKNPTGYYESNVVPRQDGRHGAVTDSGIVYGPWLEGVSPRNAATRFKGYYTFRRIQQELEPDVPRIVNKDVQQLVRELG